MFDRGAAGLSDLHQMPASGPSARGRCVEVRRADTMPDNTPNPAEAVPPATHVTEEQGAAIFAEKNRIDGLNRIRQLVFGSLDGLLVPLGVVSGVAGGTGSTKAGIVAGIPEAFAGALSMGAGEFISGPSEAHVQPTPIANDVAEIRDAPEYELREMAILFEHEGVAPEDAAHLANTLVRYPEAYHKTMVEKELGLQVGVSTVKIPEALTMGI